MSASPVVPESPRVARLLRSLVGVVDVRVQPDGCGAVSSVAILRDGRVAEHQLIRNVVSGLAAGFGIRLDPARVLVTTDAGTWEASAQPRAHEPAADDAAKAAGAPRGVARIVTTPAAARSQRRDAGEATVAASPRAAVRSGTTRGGATVPARATVGAGAALIAGATALADAGPDVEVAAPPEGAVVPADAVMPELERVDVERRGGTLYCTVEVRVADTLCSATTEKRDAPSAEAELAARATLDALRAGGHSGALLDGVALTTIADSVYVVVAVRRDDSASAQASAAPLVQTMSNAAALAVLRAHGPVRSGAVRACAGGRRRNLQPRN